MRILVTGGAGFLGSHLCRRLVRDGHQVTCLDNLSTGRGEISSGMVVKDVRSSLTGRYDQIYNLACPASPVAYQRDPVGTMMTNVQGMWNVLNMARRGGGRVLQASTSEVYGDPERSPQWEEYRGNVNPTGPRACYDEGKRAAEALCFDFARQYGVEVRVARIFNTYGPRMAVDDGRVVSNFVVQALRGEPLTVYGDGRQTRSFCYVDDLIEGLVRLMNSDVDVPVNLGNPEEIMVNSLAHMIKRLTGSESKIEYRPLPIDDPLLRRPDIARARMRLDWDPKTDLETGLTKTIEYFRERVA